MENNIVNIEIADDLKDLGFNEPSLSYYTFVTEKLYHSNEPHTYKNLYKDYSLAPTLEQVIEWLDSKGYYIDITPEFYEDGINWNWQVWWYLPKDKQNEKNHFFTKDGEKIELSNKDRFMDGTMMYGDNNEYPTRRLAKIGAIEKAIEILKQK